MPVTIRVKSRNSAVRTQREGTAQRVLDQFGDRIPNYPMLAFFDDEDCEWLKEEHGIANRGFYTPIIEDGS
jgi:hypothetical protein